LLVFFGGNYIRVGTGGNFDFFLRNENILSIMKPSKRQFRKMHVKAKRVSGLLAPIIRIINTNAQLNTKNDLARIIQNKPISGPESLTAKAPI